MKTVPILFGFVFFILLFTHSTPLSCGALAITVEKNDSVHDVATKLKEAECIYSKGLFEKYGVLFGVHVQEGFYDIPTRKNFFEYLFLFEKSTYRKAIRVTIPEGSTNKEIAALCAQKLSQCNPKRFLEKTKNKEGYLFPNTYEFIGNETEDALIAVAEKEFIIQTQNILTQLSEPEKKKIIILASILEKEANTEKDMRIVSGILYKRLKIGMALQVDATLFYERGKTSAQLTTSDLAKNSPYNTYVNTGLPPTAISNPGKVALLAALSPETTPYLFYLTGDNGEMYYARTHEEHVQNKALYLK